MAIRIRSDRRNRGDKSQYYENKKMNDEVYTLRKKAMKYIYRAKKLYNIPRITIRITENPIDGVIAGSARPGKNMIWIPEQTVKSPEWMLHWVVFHEILHAVFNMKHNEFDNPLTSTHISINKMSADQIDNLYLDYINKKD